MKTSSACCFPRPATLLTADVTSPRLDAFVPVLTILVEYGNAPFLWVVRDPKETGVGGCWCDGCCWDESFPMSEGLWRKFADWAIEFDRTRFYSDDFDAADWDWLAYHARGLHLARWLKDEVGDAYRVVYMKPYEDPNHEIGEGTEVLAGGALQHFDAPHIVRHPSGLMHRIVSGGQTGADRAALDFAIEVGRTHGGWAPAGRKAEDGPIPRKYQLVELEEAGYRQRTRLNVRDSDATLIVNGGELEGGTEATRAFAEQLGKPCLIVQLDAGVTPDAVAMVVAWLRAHAIGTLNVAGPRESKRAGIYRLTRELLLAVDAQLLRDGRRLAGDAQIAE